MAPMLKRRRHRDILEQPSKKRKSDQRNRGNPDQASAPRIVSLESLQWHQVPFPETSQDAEGFFGLEELSDVDVVRDSNKIEYKVS